MAIKIRLSRTGKKNSPSYKIVVSNQKDKRNGKALEVLGTFNPTTKPFQFTFDEKKIAEWKAKGAAVTPAVESLIAVTYS